MDAKTASDAFWANIEPHYPHTWRQVGRCVYCDDCGVRLYQGRLPADRKQPKPKPRPEPESTKRMRQRWGKD
jgi:hypothetical protein